MAESSSSYSTNIIQNTSHFIKLNETNYLAWLRQMKPFLNGAKLMDYVDGTIPKPPSTIKSTPTEGQAATNIPNLEHAKWFTIDKQIVSILISSLTEKINRLTIGFDTSKGIWDCLNRHFSQQSMASATSLKLQLFDLKKGSQYVDAYLQQAKSIVDSLASIN